MISWLKHLFVPHHGNDHRPHVLRTPVIRAFLALVIVAEAVFLFRAFDILPDGKNFAAVLASAMVQETNVDRAGEKLPELVVNPLLEEAARQKAKDMAEKGYFSHVGPDGEQPWKWLRGVGYYYLSAGENLAINFTDSKDVTDAWMNSPAHRTNMLSGNFTEIGIGTAEGVYKGKETTFVVQFFGKPYEAPETVISHQSLAISDTKPVVKVAEPALKPVLAATSVPPEMLVSQPPPPPLPLSTDVAAIPDASSTTVLGAETKVLKGNVVKAEPTMLEFLMTNPKKTTLFAAGFFAILVTIGLAFTLVVRRKAQHRDLMVNALAFLAVVLCMLIVNDYVSTKDLLLS